MIMVNKRLVNYSSIVLLVLLLFGGVPILAMSKEKLETRGCLVQLRTDFVVTGTITDAETGNPIAGALVKVKNTETAVSTDENGRYRITAPEDGVLEISYIGYEPKEIPVNNQRTINLTLQADLQQLDEVVVVGYGTQKKTSLTAAVSTVEGEAIAQKPVADLSNSLGGRVAGIIFTQG